MTALVPVINVGKAALTLAVRSVVYFVLATLIVAVLIILLRLGGFNPFGNRSFWPLVWVIWAVLGVDSLRRLLRLKAAGIPARHTNRTLHQVELVMAGFLLAYAAARPYLIDSDASAFPVVRNLFEFFILLLVGCHVTVLAIFRVRPDAWDVAALLASAVSAAFTLFG